MSDLLPIFRKPLTALADAVRAVDPAHDSLLWVALSHGASGPTASNAAIDALKALWTRDLETLFEPARVALARCNAENHRRTNPGAKIVCPLDFPNAIRFIEIHDAALALRPPSVDPLDPTIGDSSRLVCLNLHALPNTCELREVLSEADTLRGPGDEPLVVLGPAYRQRTLMVARDWYELHSAVQLTRALATSQRAREEQARVEREQQEAWAKADAEFEPTPEQMRLAALERKLSEKIAETEAARQELQTRLTQLETAQRPTSTSRPARSLFPTRYFQ